MLRKWLPGAYVQFIRVDGDSLAGGLYGEASRENFPRQTSYRNPVIAEAMKGLGFVNRYGRGVLRAQAALEKNGSPPPEFQFDAGYVLATIRRRA